MQWSTQRIAIQVENVATASDYLPTRFGYSAPTMLLLFVFITAPASGAAIGQTRGLGIYARALAAPIGRATWCWARRAGISRSRWSSRP